MIRSRRIDGYSWSKSSDDYEGRIRSHVRTVNELTDVNGIQRYRTILLLLCEEFSVLHVQWVSYNYLLNLNPITTVNNNNNFNYNGYNICSN